MNRDDITRMAREAGFVRFDGDNGSLRRFAALVAASEREACAKVCENEHKQRELYFEKTGNGMPTIGLLVAADTIRARGEK
jgi:hypothetical protein